LYIVGVGAVWVGWGVWGCVVVGGWGGCGWGGGGLLNFTGDEGTLTNFLFLQRLSSGRLEKSQSYLHYFQRTQGKGQTCLEFVLVRRNRIVSRFLSVQEG